MLVLFREIFGHACIVSFSELLPTEVATWITDPKVKLFAEAEILVAFHHFRDSGNVRQVMLWEWGQEAPKDMIELKKVTMPVVAEAIATRALKLKPDMVEIVKNVDSSLSPERHFGRIIWKSVLSKGRKGKK